MATPLTNILEKYPSEVVEVVRNFLVPGRLDCGVVKRCIRKAVRLDVWRGLAPESRALLRALALWRGVVRSRVLRSVVEELVLYIELHTLRGRAALYGALVAARSRLEKFLNSVNSLLCLGISYLSNSPVFKLLG